MAITAEPTTEPQFPGAWTVMDDGLCLSRHDTEEEAEQAAIEARHQAILSSRVSDLMDVVRDQIETEFGLSSDDTDRAIQEYLT